MGWVEEPMYGKSLDDFMDNLFVPHKFITKGYVRGGEYYRALKTTEGNVVAYVILISRRGDDICYKIMDETVHPYYYNCPVAVLDVLTFPLNENAQKWRDGCRARKIREKLPVGTVIKMPQKFTFINRYDDYEVECDTFEIVKIRSGRTLRKKLKALPMDSEPFLCHIKKWLDYDFEVVSIV